MSSPASSKQELRLHFRAVLRALSGAEIAALNSRLAPFLLQVLSQSDGTPVAVYQAMEKEASLAPLFSSGRRLCFPRTLPNSQMEFHETDPGPEHFTVGKFGIREPLHDRRLEKSEIGLCFIPLLAFDSAGRRLGQGKGYYDGFLDGFRGLKVGVAFSLQEASSVPTEPHDARLDLVVTESGIRDFRQS